MTLQEAVNAFEQADRTLTTAIGADSTAQQAIDDEALKAKALAEAKVTTQATLVAAAKAELSSLVDLSTTISTKTDELNKLLTVAGAVAGS